MNPSEAAGPQGWAGIGLFTVWAAGNAALQYAMTHEAPKDAKDLMAARIGGVDSAGQCCYREGCGNRLQAAV